jgi:hypothetical protein
LQSQNDSKHEQAIHEKLKPAHRKTSNSSIVGVKGDEGELLPQNGDKKKSSSAKAGKDQGILGDQSRGLAKEEGIETGLAGIRPFLHPSQENQPKTEKR